MAIARSNLTIAFALLAMLPVAAAALAAPNLVVRIDGSVVGSGSEQLFPDTAVGESSSIMLVLRNESAEDLVFSQSPPVFVGGAFPSQFTLVQPALETGSKLSPNGSTAFRVDFAPQIRFANVSAFVYIFTNDSASPYSLPVRGRATAPVLAVTLDSEAVSSGGSVQFSPLAVGETEQLAFVVRNSGDAPLQFTGDPIVALSGPAADQFAVIQPALEAGSVLSPLGSSAFAVRYQPSVTPVSTNVAEVRVKTNDLGGDFVIQLGAAAVATELATWGGVKSLYQ